MCGIVGLFIKNSDLEQRLGALLAAMLVEMSDRGPDSAGIAIYRDPVAAGETKLTLRADVPSFDWQAFETAAQQTFDDDCRLDIRHNHAVLVVRAAIDRVKEWLHESYPTLRLSSSGSAIEIYKEKGRPEEFIKQFRLSEFSGSHALGHTRMATESAVTTEHSHPFSTGLDLCLVHNGSLSNHNSLRRMLRREGVDFQTDNDTEVAAGYLMWRLREGDSLEQALERGLRELDGFYTFAIGTRDGFAVLRDSFGCKPAVMAENDDWAAMSSEYRAIAALPGAETARIWEPEPEKIYSWSR